VSPIDLFGAAATTGGLSVVLIRGTSPLAPAGSNEFVRLRNRRVIGWVLLVLALFLLVIASLAQFYQG
jgi:hypothetical protein